MSHSVVAVADTGHGRVMETLPDGVVKRIVDGLQQPTAVASAEDTLYVVDGDRGVVVIPADGGPRRTLAVPTDASGHLVITGVALAHQGSQLVVAVERPDSESSELWMLATDSSSPPILLPVKGDSQQFHTIATSLNGDSFYTLERGSSRVMVVHGRDTTMLDTGMPSTSALAVDPRNGDLYVASGNGQVISMHPDGSARRSIATGMGSAPAALAVDRESGDLYVTATSADRIARPSLDYMPNIAPEVTPRAQGSYSCGWNGHDQEGSDCKDYNYSTAGKSYQAFSFGCPVDHPYPYEAFASGRPLVVPDVGKDGTANAVEMNGYRTSTNSYSGHDNDGFIDPGYVSINVASNGWVGGGYYTCSDKPANPR